MGPIQHPELPAGVNQQTDFVCLNCGTRLVAHHCKVRCLKCGYFEDCSDGGNDHPNLLKGRPGDF